MNFSEVLQGTPSRFNHPRLYSSIKHGVPPAEVSPVHIRADEEEALTSEGKRDRAATELSAVRF